MKDKKSLVEDLIGIATAGAIAGPAIGIISESGLPAPLVKGTGSLIGIGLLSGAANIVEKVTKKGGFI